MEIKRDENGNPKKAPFSLQVDLSKFNSAMFEKASDEEKSQQDVDFRTVDYGIPVHVVSNCDGDFDNLNRQVFNICDKIGIFQGNRN